MARLYASLVISSFLLLLLMTSTKAKTEINRCEEPSAGLCKQECDENCRMSCPQSDPPLKSCDQNCLDGRCDMRCVTKDTCHQEQWCDTPQTCGTVRCTTTNCTQKCDYGTCNLTCRARSRCKQSCKDGSCNLKCPTGDHCDQV